jgi:transcriptional regulator with XRE-family HTH domain
VRIGEALAGARRQADLTVAEVSERTRIRATIIRAIENDDYSACGGDFYARGHIRSIAKAVGTDPEQLIHEYDTAHRAPGVYSTVSLEELLASAAEAPQHRGPDWAAGRERAAAAGASVRGWLSRAGALAVLIWVTLRHWLSLTGELAAATWTTMRLKLSRSALGAAAGPALGRVRRRLSRSAAFGLVAAMFTTARLKLSRSLRREPNRPTAGGPTAHPPATSHPAEWDEPNRPTADQAAITQPSERDEPNPPPVRPPATTQPGEPSRPTVHRPATRLPGPRRRLNWSAVLAAAVLAVIGFGIYRLVSGPGQAVSPSAASQPAGTGQPSPHPAPKASATPAAPSPAAAAPVQRLVPVHAKAFGPNGGDHPQLAAQVIRVHPAAGWHTDWYASAHFGNLYSGTGLLLDMGRPVTLTSAQISLGPARGASLQVRVGAAPALAAMPPVAHAVNTSGMVRLHMDRPAHGRYVLIWFTKLPQNAAGTFRANVYHVSLKGQTR